MSFSPNLQPALSLQFVEGSLTLTGLLVAFALPHAGAQRLRAIRRGIGSLAGRRGLSVLTVGLSVIVLRLALLPLLPIPLPFTPDDFSFLLLADTFLHGRLTNPTPALWTHFETIHVTMQPTYNSMYFPAEGLVLAASKVIFGHPWFGILIVTALMCAAICWMLQAWVPPQWALFGGLLAVIHLGLYSYWVNTYHSAGSIAALGGAVILGALPRILRKVQFRHLLLMSIGAVLVGFTRPYEGMLLCLPVAVRLIIWLVQGKNLPTWGTLVKMAALPLVLLVGAVCWLGYYDYRNFGSPTTLPYTVDRATYAIAPYFVWQDLRPEPKYRYEGLRRFYEGEVEYFVADHSLIKIVRGHLIASLTELRFLCGIALLPVLFFLPKSIFDRRVRFLSFCLLALVAGMSIEAFLLPHYLAPFTAVFYGLGTQSMRHLAVWRLQGEPVGRTLVAISILICLIMVLVRPFDRFLGLNVVEWPPTNWNTIWYGPDRFGAPRSGVEQFLDARQGNQLAIVRYSDGHESIDEWVYNGANIDGAKVIWAQDMGVRGNQELLEHYKDRNVWLVQPDLSPVSVTPYPGTKTADVRNENTPYASNP